ncbi:tRNA-dihydrouridine synthase family protein [Bacteriovorax sp. Seq25_V]|uniref:tRNA-dihydrouridine synthase family protein n=1 Tax=Bacteriovorax sp. Seq25_V TaxID=1201288 RepID=UPI00038A2F52|nr:tRNA-dihydrouridine synthase family protein [Bacteriovorax sp. Seq25_V]EQC43930.1 dihydrouridine synthase [Bacteriovorax sp. Seq25_V]
MHHFVLAPIRGVTNFIYRNALEQTFSGADSALAPYIVTKESGELNMRQLYDVEASKNLLPTTAQVLTKEADQFLHVAKIYKDLGVKKVNLNMGCPYPMVANRTKGSGLLLHPERVERLLTTIKEKCPLEFTVKIRLGREDVSEIKEIIPIINRLEINDFTIHARLGKQIYTGTVDVDAFESCLPLLETIPCYNGDINSVADYERLKKRLPMIKKWMIGRGGLSNPALFAQIKGEVFNEQSYSAKFIEMHNLITTGYLEQDNAKSDFLAKMRGHWLYFKDIFENEHKVYKKVKKAKSIEHYNDVVEWIFEQDISPKVLN